MAYFLGIDAGTSGIKAVVTGENGDTVSNGYAECDILSPRPGWIEQRAEDWWQACKTAVAQAVSISGCGKEIEGIGFSGQMQGCLPVDRNIQPLHNCIIWLDQRSDAEVAEIKVRAEGRLDTLGITANACLNSFWAPKLLWLRKHKPEAFERTHKVLFAKDYLRYCMTGEIAADVSDASLSYLMDVPGRRWSDEMFDLLDIPNGFVPQRLAESCEVVGTLRKELAEEWGMRPGIAVTAGGGDQPVGGVGAGIIQEGVIGATIGTSGVVFGSSKKPFADPKDRAMLSMAHAVPDTWCFLGLVLSAGASFKWLRDTFFTGKKMELQAQGEDVYDYMTALASQASVGSEGLMFMPYLNGEKTPYSDSYARGVWFGFSHRHSLNEICRSVMEGVTFAMRDSVEVCRELGICVNEVRANGGGAKSALWRQMQADVYNASIVTMNVQEGPASGAAILAGVGTGCFQSVAEGCDAMLRVKSVTDPIAKNVRIYEEYYQMYRALYPALKERFAAQAALVGKSF